MLALGTHVNIIFCVILLGFAFTCRCRRIRYCMLSVVNWQASWHWNFRQQVGVRKWDGIPATNPHSSGLAGSKIVHWWCCPVQTHSTKKSVSFICSILLRLYHNYDSTTIRLRYDDTRTHSTMTKVIIITICVRFDCDTTTTKNWHVHFCSLRI